MKIKIFATSTLLTLLLTMIPMLLHIEPVSATPSLEPSIVVHDDIKQNQCDFWD